jgi:hypothetical protein
MAIRLDMETDAQPLVLIDCASCAIQFAVPESWDRNRRRAGDGFFCPNGHSLTYGKSEADKLKQQLKTRDAQLSSVRDQCQAAQADAMTQRRRASAARGQVTRIKNRITHGVCPCCHRTFPELAAHMATQHPGYQQEPADGS